jgi:serine/threonine protein kinase
VPSLPMVGDDLAGYRLIGVLGRSGMSVVYEAENPRLGNTVALKVLVPELAANDVFRARFLKESRIAASLSHPNVIPIYDMGSHEDLLYIAMRYVAGADLRGLLKAQHSIPPLQALSLIGQTGRALDIAHLHGLVHRDVKPGNILIEQLENDDDPGHVYLTDFGITKHAASRSGLTATGEFMGTIDYIAPEQIRGKSVDGRADIYSLGCVLYECLTGRVPFEKDIQAAVLWAHVEEMPAMPSTLRPELPAGIDAVLARVLAKDPGERYPTCRELVSAARTALQGSATSAEQQQGTGSPRSDTVWVDLNSPGAPVRQPGSLPAAYARPFPPAGGQQPAAGDGRAARHRPPRGPLLLAGAGILAVIIAATAVWVTSRGSPARSTSRPMAARMPTHSMAPNHVMQALALANLATHGLLPTSTCRAQSTTLVTCSRPNFAIQTVSFRTYPSQDALYKAYTAAVRSLGIRHGTNSIRTNFGDCSKTMSYGEVSWNHDFRHPKTYSLAQSRSGRLMPATQAAGRVACTITGSQYDLVWTEDAGHMLAKLSGSPHDAAWRWWRAVHHDIAMRGAPMHM